MISVFRIVWLETGVVLCCNWESNHWTQRCTGYCSTVIWHHHHFHQHHYHHRIYIYIYKLFINGWAIRWRNRETGQFFCWLSFFQDKRQHWISLLSQFTIQVGGHTTLTYNSCWSLPFDFLVKLQHCDRPSIAIGRNWNKQKLRKIERNWCT